MRFVSVVWLACACTAARPVETPKPPEEVPPAVGLEGYRASFLLTWNGARIGDARESLVAHGDGYRFERSERILVRRDGALAPSGLTIRIDVDDQLVATRVRVEPSGGARTEAVREGGRWRIRSSGKMLDGAAVPATLVPLLVAARGAAPGRAFDGPVLVEGAGLALARLTVDIEEDERSAAARLDTPVGELLTTVALDAQGLVIAAGDVSGVASRRVDARLLEAPFDPPELVEAAAVPVSGAVHTSGTLWLEVQGVAVPGPLDEVPTQRITTSEDGWQVIVQQAPSVPTELARRTHWASRRLDDDLALTLTRADDALAAGRGDCTAHSVVLADDLAARGYEVRLVTGFVLVDGELRRHRWVAVRAADESWVNLDPMLDEAPASPAHLALAVHAADELSFVDDVVFAGWSAARVTVRP